MKTVAWILKKKHLKHSQLHTWEANSMREKRGLCSWCANEEALGSLKTNIPLKDWMKKQQLLLWRKRMQLQLEVFGPEDDQNAKISLQWWKKWASEVICVNSDKPNQWHLIRRSIPSWASSTYHAHVTFPSMKSSSSKQSMLWLMHWEWD